MSQPSITVVITCQDRRTFLLEAVKSALGQDLDPSEYEIIVVKNFDDELIDNKLKEFGIRTFLSGTGPVSQKHAIAIKEAKGEIVSFLDDDDVFSRVKLRIVKERFNSHPDAVYYHNGMCFDERALLTDVAANDTSSATLYKSGDEIDWVNLRRLNMMTPNYNLSSMSFRREFLLKNLETILQVYRDIDFAWYMLSLVSGGTVIADSVPLTYYRRHEEGTSRATNVEKIKKYSQQAIGSYSLLSKYLDNEQIRNLCSYYIEDWKAKLVLLSLDRTKRERLSELKQFIKTWKWRATTKWYSVVLFLLLISSVSVKASTSAYPKFFR